MYIRGYIQNMSLKDFIKNLKKGPESLDRFFSSNNVDENLKKEIRNSISFSNYISDQVNLDNLEIIKYLHEIGIMDFDNCIFSDFMNLVFMSDSINIFSYIFQVRNISEEFPKDEKENIIQYANNYSANNILHFVIENFELDLEEIYLFLEWSVKDLEIFRVIFEKYKHSIDISNNQDVIFNTACVFGESEVVEYIYNLGTNIFIGQNTLSEVCRSDKHKIFEFLCLKYPEIIPEEIENNKILNITLLERSQKIFSLIFKFFNRLKISDTIICDCLQFSIKRAMFDTFLTICTNYSDQIFSINNQKLSNILILTYSELYSYNSGRHYGADKISSEYFKIIDKNFPGKIDLTLKDHFFINLISKYSSHNLLDYLLKNYQFSTYIFIENIIFFDFNTKYHLQRVIGKDSIVYFDNYIVLINVDNYLNYFGRYQKELYEIEDTEKVSYQYLKNTNILACYFSFNVQKVKESVKNYKELCRKKRQKSAKK